MALRWRTYRLCRLLRCTPTELDEQPGALLDWFLQFDRIENELQEAESKRQAR